jgi:hypothetical protein
MSAPPELDREPPLRRRGTGTLPLLAVAASALLLPLPVTLALTVAALAWRVGRSAARRRAHAAGSASNARQPGTLVLGSERSGDPVLISERALTAHTLVLGASGAGKSTTMLRLLSERIAHGAPVVAIDLKGSPGFADGLRAAASAAGRGFQLWTPDGPAAWNPLAHGNATELKDKLISTERFSEPHYKRAAERYLQLAIQVAGETRGDGAITLQRVVELLEPKRLAAAARTLPGPFGQRVREYVTSLTSDQVSAVRGLGTRLAIVTDSHTGAFLGAPGHAPGAVDLHAALGADNPDVVLFSLNSSRYGQLAAQLGTLAVQDLVTASGARLEQRASGPAALVAIDEFSALGADNVLALLARGREAGVGVILATQELADLDRAARGLRDQVLGNTAVKIAHRQDVPESAQTVARLAGTVLRWERSYQERPGRLPGTRVGAGSTARLGSGYAVEPETIRTLPTGYAVVVSKVPEARTQLTRITPPARRSAQPPVPGVTR